MITFLVIFTIVQYVLSNDYCLPLAAIRLPAHRIAVRKYTRGSIVHKFGSPHLSKVQLETFMLQKKHSDKFLFNYDPY